MMEDVKVDAKEEVNTEVDSSSTEKVESAETTAVVAKTEGTEVEKKETAEEPWHKDPRFKKFLDEKKSLEDRAEAFKGIEQDPDFASFLAMKRQKEAMKAEEKKIDFSTMTAEEYAEHVANVSKEAARSEYRNLVEANKKGDELSREAVSFAESRGVDKPTFEKEYAPKILAYYEDVGKKIGMNNLDKFVMAHPPKEVFKSIFFDKAEESGVKKYKAEVDKASKAGFEQEGKVKDEGEPKDDRSRFERDWAKAFGSATELPQSALNKRG